MLKLKNNYANRLHTKVLIQGLDKVTHFYFEGHARATPNLVVVAELHAAAPEPRVHHVHFRLFLGAAHKGAAAAGFHAHAAAVAIYVRVLVKIGDLCFWYNMRGLGNEVREWKGQQESNIEESSKTNEKGQRASSP